MSQSPASFTARVTCSFVRLSSLRQQLTHVPGKAALHQLHASSKTGSSPIAARHVTTASKPTNQNLTRDGLDATATSSQQSSSNHATSSGPPPLPNRTLTRARDLETNS
ncbi:hypothetical protein Syun_007376 [Stephania yunnanensis]|uniref:Uncharacterized protein n=1 Tax=Stephania yunnanensis TaxID=152371 RepID=A0AAP0PZB3_9MAGN